MNVITFLYIFSQSSNSLTHWKLRIAFPEGVPISRKPVTPLPLDEEDKIRRENDKILIITWKYLYCEG
jgi:hypothetical protein